MNLSTLSGGLAQKTGEVVGNPEKLDGDLTGGFWTGIASQTCLPRETGVRLLRTGEDHVRIDGSSLDEWERGWAVHLDPLISQKVLTGTSVLPATPISRWEPGLADPPGENDVCQIWAKSAARTGAQL